jgi:hypothetical protein
MSKFVVVKQAPATLDKGEIVIGQPDFSEQITENIKKAPKHGQTSLNHMREILNSIRAKYDPDMNVFKVNLTNYKGLTYKNNQELSTIFVRLLKDQNPVIFDKYLEFQLKNRPTNTKLIYYVGDFTTSGPFYKAGLDLIEEKDIESYMTGKPKKVVGKPAVSDEEAKSNNS